ncbi:hypothetical protein J4402_01175 [Candidatus Pacearchaeota archaeon]|nr:hypothetical protein [Candidatus Pacearchaeota archaeon]
MAVKINNSRKKIRINITVDKTNLKKAQKQLGLFGGKLSTLFNAYLRDFVKSAEKKESALGAHKDLIERVKELERKIAKIEDKKI